jgi:hypothetical protein
LNPLLLLFLSIVFHFKMKMFVTVLLLSIALGANAFSAPLATPSSNDKASWNIDSMLNIMRVEGNSRRTWDFGDLTKDTVQTVLTSSGRPIGADVELWIGPNWTPFKMKVYSEDGQLRPVQTLVGTRNMAARVECRNTYAMEFPFNAACAYAKAPLSSVRKQIPESISPRYVEGGAVYMVPFDSEAEQVQVLLQTDARQLSAKVELLNGMC